MKCRTRIGPLRFQAGCRRRRLNLALVSIPPYGSNGWDSLLLCVCTVTDFSAAEKDSGVKLRVLVRLLRDELLPFW